MMPEILQEEAFRELLNQQILLGALIAARIVPLVQIVPYLGAKAVPQTVKISLTMALVLLVYPSVWLRGAASGLPDNTVAISLLVVKEVFVGITLGFVCTLAFEAVRMAGQIIDNNAGLTQATTMVPQLPDRVSPTSNLLLQISIVIFFAIGGHRVFLWALVKSFQRIEPQSFLDMQAGLTEVALTILRLSADAILLGVLMSFPVVAAILLTNLFLALVNKSAPQINVFFLGMPLKAALATAVVFLSLDAILQRLIDRLLDDLQVLMQILELL